MTNKTNPNNQSPEPSVKENVGSRTLHKTTTLDNNPFDNLIKELETLFKDSGLIGLHEKKTRLETAKQCKKIHEEYIIKIIDIYNQDYKQKVQKLKDECKEKWDKGNFVLANVNEMIDKIFGGQDD